MHMGTTSVRIVIVRQPPQQQSQITDFRQAPVNARKNTDSSEFPNNECH